ncbi:MAG: MauE/DoxX family redox-associated membrane protein [Mycobacteriales bacterium]
MRWLAGPYLAAALLLAVAGAPKVLRPESATRALASLRLPSSTALVRGLGAAELAIAGAALATRGPLAPGLVAASYAVFSGVVALALVRGGVLSSCGCFGRPDTPPTRTHLAVTLGFAATAVAVAVRPVGRLPEILAGAPMAGLPFLALTSVCVWFAYLALAVLPRSGARAASLAASGRWT